MRRGALLGFFSRDIIDQEIRQLCERYPEISEDNTIVRKAQGRYRINGREVSVSLVTREARDEESEAEALPLGPDDLVVRDGPLTQPFLEYVFDTGEKEKYALESTCADTEQGSQPLASELRGGQLCTEPHDRLEAMSLAWASVAAEAERPAPPRSGDAAPAAQPDGQPLCLAERSYKESVMEILMDMPIVETSSFACQAISLCAPEACGLSLPQTATVVQPTVLGPRFSSTTKPKAEGEIDPSPCYSLGLSRKAVVDPAVEEAVKPCESTPRLLDGVERRRHRFSEVIMPGELEEQVAAQVRSKPPSKPPPAALSLLDEIQLTV